MSEEKTYTVEFVYDGGTKAFGIYKDGELAFSMSLELAEQMAEAINQVSEDEMRNGTHPKAGLN